MTETANNEQKMLLIELTDFITDSFSLRILR